MGLESILPVVGAGLGLASAARGGSGVSGQGLTYDQQLEILNRQQQYDAQQAEKNNVNAQALAQMGYTQQSSESQKARDAAQALAQMGYTQESSESQKARDAAQALAQMGYQSQEGLQKGQQAYEQGLFNTKQQNYEDIVGRGGADELSAEGALFNDLNLPSQSLSEMQRIAREQGAKEQEQTLNTVNSQLANQGVRGPRAALIAGRVSGDLNKNLYNQLATMQYNDEQQRRAQKQQYLMGKAQTGQKATLQTPGYYQ